MAYKIKPSEESGTTCSIDDQSLLCDIEFIVTYHSLCISKNKRKCVSLISGALFFSISSMLLCAVNLIEIGILLNLCAISLISLAVLKNYFGRIERHVILLDLFRRAREKANSGKYKEEIYSWMNLASSQEADIDELTYLEARKKMALLHKGAL